MRLKYWMGGSTVRLYITDLPWGNARDLWIEQVGEPRDEGADWRVKQPADNRNLAHSLARQVEFSTMLDRQLRLLLTVPRDQPLASITFKDLVGIAGRQRAARRATVDNRGPSQDGAGRQRTRPPHVR